MKSFVVRLDDALLEKFDRRRLKMFGKPSRESVIRELMANWVKNAIALPGRVASQKARISTLDIAEWEPKPPHFDLAQEAGYDERWIFEEAEHYRDWWRNAKRKHKDCDAGFRNWIREQIRRERQSTGKPGRNSVVGAANDLIARIYRENGEDNP